MSTTRTCRTVPILLAMLLICSVVGAAPYWGPEEVEAWLERQEVSGDADLTETPPFSLDAPFVGRDVSHELMLARIANFLSVWQVSDPEDPDYGGMREGEHLPNIIQTDNTSESIWVWTRYYEVTGDNQYFPNVEAAWAYCMNRPAYLEEGGDTPRYGYYRMYNCGWAVRAELKYRQTYGDLTYKDYGDSCGSYIVHHTLDRFGSGFYDYVNPHVLAWALGNLYYAGEVQYYDAWVEHAALEAETKVKTWIEDEPTLLGNETWAMSGGATIWGLLESYFRANPGETAGWVNTYKDQIDTFSDAGDFTNAWNGWYALGHHAVGRALDDPAHYTHYTLLTDYLIAEDADEDGGIPAKPEDTDEMDQTWVANYLAFMGVSDGLGATSSVASDAPRWRVDLSVSPNPATGAMRLALRLAEAADVTVSVFDLAGRRIASLYEGSRPAGVIDLRWNGLLSDGTRAPAGRYYAVARSGSERHTASLVLVR